VSNGINYYPIREILLQSEKFFEYLIRAMIFRGKSKNSKTGEDKGKSY